MSTMREQFEAWAKIPIWWRNGETYDDLHTAQAWAAWQAATEAAKATGTAGELPPLPEAWITDYTTTDPAARLHFAADQMREYGQACAEAARYDADAATRLRLVCKLVGIESHVPADDETLWGAAFAVLGQIRAALETARQPAPVAEQGDLPLPKGLTDFIYSADLYAVLMDAQHVTNAPATTWMANKMIVKLDKLKEDMRDHLDRECKEASIAATNRSQP